MKRLAFALMFAVSALQSFADTETVDGITWTYTVFDGKASVSALPMSTTGDISIPTTLGDCLVTSIRSYAFYDCSGLTSITIPDGVTSIGESAFVGCSGLKKVHISNLAAWCGISFADSRANPYIYAHKLFLNNEEISNLVVPDGVTSIGSYAFSGCSGLTSITIPDSVTSIGTSAFNGCSGLTSLRVLNGDTTIERGTFSGCSKLTDIEIPQCVCATNLSVFFPSWRTMTNIVVAEGVGYIADSAFEGCAWLERVTVPWTVTRIGQRVFYDCIRLREVVFEGDAPDRIGEDVFGGTQRSLVCLVPDQSIGWDGGVSTTLPDSWNGRGVAVGSQQGHGAGGGSSGGGAASVVRLSVSNIVVHYVTQSIPSDAVIPPTTSGIVNVVAEVGSGGAIAIPSEWAAQYPDFETRFGSDYSAALTAETGKTDGAGHPMYVWQDYVAGTDPTDPASVFTASITFDAATGEPVITIFARRSSVFLRVLLLK